MRTITKITIGALLLTSQFACIGAKKQPDCVENGKPSDFWSNYGLPSVAGSEFCREDTRNAKDAFISFVHYGESGKSSIDYVKPYQVDLEQRGWVIEGINNAKENSSIYANKGDKRMLFLISDCFKKGYEYRACTEVSTRETNERYIKK